MKQKLHVALLVFPIVFGLICTSVVFAQDSHFSQFNNAPMTINPALTGSFNGDMRVLLNYRNQWSSVANPYTTFDLALDFKMLTRTWSKGFIGGGFYVMNDDANSANMTTLQANLNLAAVRYLGDENQISGGIQAGYNQRTLNSSGLQFGSQYDYSGGVGSYNSNNPSGENGLMKSVSYPDFGAGLNWSFTKDEKYSTANNKLKANFGIAAFHLTNPNYSFYPGEKDLLDTKYVVNGGLYFGLPNTNVSLVPSFLFTHQGGSQEINVGSMVRYTLQNNSRYTGRISETALSLGLFYRVNDAVIPTLMMEWANYALGLSYDINVSALDAASANRGGLEFALRFITPNPFGTSGGSTRNVRFL